MERRHWLRFAGGLGALGAAGAGAALLLRGDAAGYAAAVEESRAGPRAGESPAETLLRYGTLAPNSHNTQPWRFRLRPDAVTILPDFTRRTPSVDPDDHHLFASLGCALETMVQAAPSLGLAATPEPGDAAGATLRLEPATARPGPLSDAIPRRQSTRGVYDGTPLTAEELRLLEQAGQVAGVETILLTAPAQRETLLDLIVAGNAAQLRDPAFVAELLDWIRFSHAEALARRDGLFGAASGNPVVPGPVGRLIFPHVFTLAGETDKYVRQVRSSAGLAVFSADRDDPSGWIAAGRAAQRFCLQAAALGIRNAWVNQPVEVPGLRAALAAWLGIAPRRPDLVLRFGRGPALPFSLRRPVAATLA